MKITVNESVGTPKSEGRLHLGRCKNCGGGWTKTSYLDELEPDVHKYFKEKGYPDNADICPKCVADVKSYLAQGKDEARNDYKTFKIGPVKVRLEGAFSGHGGTSIPIAVEVPPGGEAWDRDTFVTKDILNGNKLANLLKEQYRIIIGTALFNANRDEIVKDKYDFNTFAKREEEMLADSANIEALKAEIKKRLEDFEG